MLSPSEMRRLLRPESIPRILTLYGQHIGTDRIKLPHTVGGTAETAFVLSRRAMPSDLVGVINTTEASTTSTVPLSIVINAFRFYLKEDLIGTLILDGSVTVRVTVAVRTSDPAATAWLHAIQFNLRKLIGPDTFSEIGLKWIMLFISSTATTYVDRSIVMVIPIGRISILRGEKLCLEITTGGMISATPHVCWHRLSFAAGSSETYMDCGVWE